MQCLSYTLGLSGSEVMADNRLCGLYAKGTPSPHVGAPTACRRMVSGSFSLLCSRFFSPFLHSTGSLSVSREYLALRDGPRRFIQDFSCPALLRILLSLSLVSPTGLSPSLTGLSRPFGYLLLCLMQSFYPDSAETESVWALPLSLATTDGIIVIFFSCG